MSYDVGMEVDTGAEWPVSVGEWHNYTYNVAPMFALAFEADDGIRSLHGLTGAEAAPRIEAAVRYFEQHMDEMRALNPPNGWGNAEGALRFLRRILEEARAHPKATVGVS